MAVARRPVARIAPPAPAIISASRARVGDRDGERGNFPLILQCRQTMLVAVHGLALRSASDAIRAPLTELLKPDCCRAPPRSSHRAAGARHHQRLALASG